VYEPMQTEATTATSVRSSGPSSSRHHRSSRGGLRVDEEMNVTTSKQRQNPSSTHHSSRTSTSAGRSRPHPQAPPSNGQHSSQQQSTPNGSQQPQSESTSHRSTSQDVSARRNESGSYPQRRPAYLLHRDLVIGKGSYGQVCIASRGETEGGKPGKRKKFACKCVVLRSDPKYIAKLQEEVNVLRELRGHENVIRLYDVFCVDNELFIITELGRGGDLFHLLTTHPKHGVTEAYAGEFIQYLFG